MKLLRKTIRRLILQESLKLNRRKSYEKEQSSSGMVTELESNEKASIEYWKGSYFIKIERGSETIAKMQLSPIANEYDFNWSTRDDCYDQHSETHLEVGPDDSQAEHGYGPLMYDIALEYAYQLGTSIVPDRTGVSGAASNMWKHYKDKRSDVRFTPFKSDHPCFYEDYDFDREHLNGAYYKPNREYLDGLGVETP
jgi:hypothetical protein